MCNYFIQPSKKNLNCYGEWNQLNLITALHMNYLAFSVENVFKNLD